MRRLCVPVAAGILMLLATRLRASELCRQEVRFEKWASSATYSGRVSGFDFCEYTLTAAAGQHLRVSLAGKHSNRIEANLFDPGQEVPLDSGKTITLKKNGLHRIRVDLPRAFARRGVSVSYDITIAIH